MNLNMLSKQWQKNLRLITSFFRNFFFSLRMSFFRPERRERGRGADFFSTAIKIQAMCFLQPDVQNL